MGQGKFLGLVRQTAKDLGTRVGRFEWESGQAHLYRLALGDLGVDLIEEVDFLVRLILLAMPLGQRIPFDYGQNLSRSLDVRVVELYWLRFGVALGQALGCRCGGKCSD